MLFHQSNGIYFVSSSDALLVLHSFPTRRSSDLAPPGGVDGPVQPGLGPYVDPRRLYRAARGPHHVLDLQVLDPDHIEAPGQDRKSTRLNSSHSSISYAVFCLKKKKYHYTIIRNY